MITKKVKSFSIEDEVYERLYSMLKANLTEVTISYYMNKFMKELLGYFEGVDRQRRAGPYSVPLSFILDFFAKERIPLGLLEKREPGDDESRYQSEMKEWQRRYDVFMEESGGRNYGESQEPGKKYPVSVVLKFAAEVAALQIVKNRDLTDDEMKDVVGGYGGKDFIIYLREHAVPALDKVDLYGKMEKAIKERMRRRKGKD